MNENTKAINYIKNEIVLLNKRIGQLEEQACYLAELDYQDDSNQLSIEQDMAVEEIEALANVHHYIIDTNATKDDTVKFVSDGISIFKRKAESLEVPIMNADAFANSNEEAKKEMEQLIDEQNKYVHRQEALGRLFDVLVKEKQERKNGV
jgi:hypothetical protein